MSIILKSGASSDTANVTSNNQVEVFTGDASNPAEVGATRLFSENDHGDITGTAYILSPETSENRRLRVGTDTTLDSDSFNSAAQNTSKYNYTNTTMTAALSGGGLVTNSGSSVATSVGINWRTYSYFPLLGSGSLYYEQTVMSLDTPASNSFFHIGGFVVSSAITTPTDGVFFRVTSTGVYGVSVNAGTEQATSAFTFTWTLNKTYKFAVAYYLNKIIFFIDNVIYGSLDRPSGFGLASSAMALPWSVQHYTTGVAPTSVWRMKVFNYNVAIRDIATNRLWETQRAGMGLSSIQGASGHTQGQTSNNTNSAAPASATLSNTAAGYTTLGGQFQFAAVAGAETDYALFAFLNTAPTTAITGRNLVIRGIWIDTFNMGAAVATTPTLLQWTLGVGSTAVSLATAEAATTRAPRRIGLGVQSFPVGAAIGASASRIAVGLDAPVVVEPSTYLHVILKMPVGTATAAQIVRGIVGINGYWE